MSFLKKTWLARIGVGLNRFRMNNSTDVVLESNPVSITQQGDQLSADNMNNLETRIGNAFDEMAGNLATIEVSPSQHNWTAGSQIVYNGILYKVTSAISTGDNLVVNTNIEPYPVSSALSDINGEINAISENIKARTFGSIGGTTIDDFLLGVDTALHNIYNPLDTFCVWGDWLARATYLIQGCILTSTRSFFTLTSYTATSYSVIVYDGVVYKKALN